MFKMLRRTAVPTFEHRRREALTHLLNARLSMRKQYTGREPSTRQVARMTAAYSLLTTAAAEVDRAAPLTSER